MPSVADLLIEGLAEAGARRLFGVTDGGSSGVLLATRTATEDSSRRPARPHIWRSEATVPGNVTTTAASSSPTSMPSSSASVVITARSWPSLSWRSTSRRCAGV